MEKANSEGKKLTTEERKAIRAENTMTRKNANNTNKIIKRENAIMNGVSDIMYKTFWYYKKEKDKR